MQEMSWRSSDCRKKEMQHLPSNKARPITAMKGRNLVDVISWGVWKMPIIYLYISLQIITYHYISIYITVYHYISLHIITWESCRNPWKVWYDRGPQAWFEMSARKGPFEKCTRWRKVCGRSAKDQIGDSIFSFSLTISSERFAKGARKMCERRIHSSHVLLKMGCI